MRAEVFEDVGNELVAVHGSSDGAETVGVGKGGEGSSRGQVDGSGGMGVEMAGDDSDGIG